MDRENLWIMGAQNLWIGGKDLRTKPTLTKTKISIYLEVWTEWGNMAVNSSVIDAR